MPDSLGGDIGLGNRKKKDAGAKSESNDNDKRKKLLPG